MQHPEVAEADPRVIRSKQAVIEAALELLSERGVTATTVEAISERSGVAKTTIYRHWPGKPEVVLDAIRTLISPPDDPDTGSLRQDLYILTEGLARALGESRMAALIPSLIAAAERDAAFAALHRNFVAAQHQVVRDVCLRGVGRGELPAGTDVDEVVVLLAGPLFYRRSVTHDRLDAGFSQRVVDVVLDALSP